jgi:hypothetical protein
VTVTSSLDRGTSGETSVTPPADAPLWLRLAEYAIEREAGGAVLLEAGELLVVVTAWVGRDVKSSEVSRAIRRAISAGWLAHRSSTRVLLVPASKRRARGGAR